MSMASEPLTPEMEKEIRDWLALQDTLYIKGGVWNGRKREDRHVWVAAMVDEIDRLRKELAIVEQENAEVRAGAERECNRLRSALQTIADFCGNGWFGYQDGDRFGGFYPGQIARAALEGNGR